MRLFALTNEQGVIQQTAQVAHGIYEDGARYGDLTAHELPEGTDLFGVMSRLYWDNGWQEMPPQPSPHHIWNADTRSWTENVDGARQQLLTDLKRAQRWGELNLSVEWQGVVFNSNLETENALMVAILADAFPQQWRTKDESYVELTKDDAISLLAAVRARKVDYKHEYWQIKDAALTATCLADLPFAEAQAFCDQYDR